MKTFNGKPQHRNIVAVILGIIGIAILSIAWVYHLAVHFITMPRDEWIDLKDKDNWINNLDYPNTFCDWFCNIEASMIHQLYILRTGFGREYCKEDDTINLTDRRKQ